VNPTISIKLTDNWVEFNLRFVIDYKTRRTTKTNLFQDLIKAFDATNGKVTLASATFDIVGMPEIKVDMKSSTAQ